MADQTIPDYETIRAAVTGETWAVEKLIEALPQFLLEEMEREEKRNRDKKS